MHKRTVITSLLICLSLSICLSLLISGCDSQPQPVTIDPGKRSDATVKPALNTEKGQTIKLGIGSMITPKEGYIYYRRLADYLEKQLKWPVVIVDRGTYQEFNELLANDGLDLAFVCGGPYVEGHKDFQLELLVVPETPAGETVYYSYLIVPQDSPAETIEDLRGLKFAFTDPQSNTGCLVPTYMLALQGETPGQFFNETLYTYAHDKSIQAVASTVVDGAAVDSLIYDYLATTNPDLVKKTKILSVSEPYGIPPVVIRPNLPQDVQQRLRTALLEMNGNAEGQSILKGMMIGRFVPSNDASYDSIRKMEQFLETNGRR